ncbi:MAG: GAF domain-containing protein, partial [Armatimonadota bacterium]
MKRPKASSLIWRIAALAAVLFGITLLVRLSGTDSIAVHLYYLPIIYAGYYFGDYGAILTSLIATFLCGPFMPARYTVQGEPVRQEALTILVRMCMFYVVGLAASKIALELKRRASEAQHLYEVAHSITGSLRLNEVLDLITSSAVDVMGAKACSIRLLDEESGELVPAAMSGLSEDYWQKGSVSPEESPVDRKALQGESVQIMDVTENGSFQYPEEARAEGITSVLTVPLREKEKTCGVIRVYARRKRRFSAREEELLGAFADQAAVAIENARLYENIRRNYYETVKALTTAVEARDSATYNHSQRVTELADKVARAMGLSNEDREM